LTWSQKAKTEKDKEKTINKQTNKQTRTTTTTTNNKQERKKRKKERKKENNNNNNSSKPATATASKQTQQKSYLPKLLTFLLPCSSSFDFHLLPLSPAWFFVSLQKVGSVSLAALTDSRFEKGLQGFGMDTINCKFVRNWPFRRLF